EHEGEDDARLEVEPREAHIAGVGGLVRETLLSHEVVHDRRRHDRLSYSLAGTNASASISTSIWGSMRRLTWTMDVAGRIPPKNSPWARPTCSHWEMSVTYIRVRTTCSSRAPARASARSMLRSVCTACAYASPAPTTRPASSVAVVPETWTTRSTRTARE